MMGQMACTVDSSSLPQMTTTCSLALVFIHLFEPVFT